MGKLGKVGYVGKYDRKSLEPFVFFLVRPSCLIHLCFWKKRMYPGVRYGEVLDWFLMCSGNLVKTT